MSGLGVDPWPKISRNGGYSPAFLKKIKAARRHDARTVNAELSAPLAPFVLDELRRFRERGVPTWAVDIARAVCAAHGVSVAAVAGKVVNDERVNGARRATIYAIKDARPGTSSLTLGKWFDRHHTSILSSLAIHQIGTGSPPLTGFNANKKKRGSDL